jgi:hypothetical protein
MVNHDFGEAGRFEAVQMPADQRLAAGLEQGFGTGIGERAHALAAAGGQYHGFHGLSVGFLLMKD